MKSSKPWTELMLILVWLLLKAVLQRYSQENVVCKYAENLQENTLGEAGSQGEIFQGRGGFLELGHFDKLFVFKNTREKSPLRKILELLLLVSLKSTFWIEDSTQGWTMTVFFSKSRHFFRFSKKAGEASIPSPPPSSCAPAKCGLNKVALQLSLCNFQSIKSPVELNSLFLKFFCYITWFD